MNTTGNDSYRQALRLIQAQQWPAALQNIDQALVREARDSRLWLLKAQCLLRLGRHPQACEAAAAAQRNAPADPGLLDAVGTVFSRANDQQRAAEAYDRAVSLAPDNSHFIFNRAAVRRFLGDLAEAERDYDRVVALRADDYEAYRSRSELRTQTRESNHVAELEALIARQRPDWRGEVELRHALAKECEDLGEHERSFEHLQRGARLRRAHLQYDVAVDVATVEWIIEAFPGARSGAPPGVPSREPAAPPSEAPSAASPDAAQAAAGGGGPIFIVGLPRSGSTLVERILGCHSQLTCAGELHDFALAIVAATHRLNAGRQLTRCERVAQSAQLDFPALGRDYQARVRAAGIQAERFVDKMPLNYLYCGLIRRALPAARIVHVSRSPMAACYAIYKTLFQDGYPFSYNLEELGRYYVAYRRLMQHWEATLPGALLELRYEELVADQLGQTRRLLRFCGLEWEDGCAEFHRNPAPTTTASAAQVRRRMYGTSLFQWRHYQQQLEPLRAQLTAAGISTDG